MKRFISMLFGMLVITISYAQDLEPLQKDSITNLTSIQHLDEVIVSGNLKTDPIHSVVSNNSSSRIVQPKNVADLFNNINGFSVVKRGNYAIDPSFRAAQYEQLNVQYDGGTKVMHACPNRMDPITTHVSPEEITKIEIVKGPFTVRYGATFGGIVNLITGKPQFGETGLHGEVSTSYESNGDALVSALKLQQVDDRYDLVGNFGYRDFGNYEDGDGNSIPSSFRSIDYGLKVGYNLSDNQRIQGQFRQSFGRDVLHAGLPMDTEYDDSSIASLDYKLELENGLMQYVNAKLYYSYVDHLMNNYRRPSFAIMEASSSIDATTMGGKLEVKLAPGPDLLFFTGLDANLIGRDGSRTRIVKQNMQGEPLPTPLVFVDKVWQDSRVDDYGVFAESKWSINDSSILTVGMRYDMVLSSINDPEADFAALYNLSDRTEHNLSGTVSLRKIFSDSFILETAFGRGVRSANMIERFINHFTVGQDPYEYIGNPNLEAEVNNQFEIGFKGKKVLGSNSSSLNYSASVYYSLFENYIMGVIDTTLTRKYNPMLEPVNPKVFRNLEDAYRYGFEAALKYDFLEDYYLSSEMAYVQTKNKDLDESLPLTPPLKTRFVAGIEKEKYWANLQLNLVSEQTDIARSFGETATDGYNTVDFRCGFVPIKSIRVGAAVINIFDETYHDHLNFSFVNQADFGRVPINDPGRNFSGYVQYSF